MKKISKLGKIEALIIVVMLVSIGININVKRLKTIQYDNINTIQHNNGNVINLLNTNDNHTAVEIESITDEELQGIIDDNESKINQIRERLNSEIARQTALENEMSIGNDKTNINNTFLKAYPIGSIYISYNNTNPGTLFGGTWESFGSGRTLVGINSSDTDFDTVGKTGGEKTHTLTVAEMPSHTHTFTGKSHSHTPSNTGTKFMTVITGSNCVMDGTARAWWSYNSSYSDINKYFMYVAKASGVKAGCGEFEYTQYATAGGTNSNVGGGGAHNNLQPYITVYMFKRTA